MKSQSQLQQMLLYLFIIIIIFFFFIENKLKICVNMIHMKYQDLFFCEKKKKK